MSPKKRILFIVNPISGIGKQKVIPELVKSELDHRLFDAEIRYTERAGHAKDIAKTAIADGFDIVCAVGGDGSVNEVASALAHSDVAMAIIPTGSGNGLARHLTIPLKPELAMRKINELNTQRIDTGTLNEHFFVGTAGLGFDAHIARVFDESGKRGAFNYVRLTLKEFFNYKPIAYQFICNGTKHKERAMLITFANSCQWGNNAIIAPGANLSDGQIRMCLLKPFNLFAAIGIASKLFKSKLKNSNKYLQITGREVLIENATGPAHIDGEPIYIEGTAEVRIQPASLSVLC